MTAKRVKNPPSQHLLLPPPPYPTLCKSAAAVEGNIHLINKNDLGLPKASKNFYLPPNLAAIVSIGQLRHRLLVSPCAVPTIAMQQQHAARE